MPRIRSNAFSVLRRADEARAATLLLAHPELRLVEPTHVGDPLADLDRIGGRPGRLGTARAARNEDDDQQPRRHIQMVSRGNLRGDG